MQKPLKLAPFPPVPGIPTRPLSTSLLVFQQSFEVGKRVMGYCLTLILVTVGSVLPLSLQGTRMFIVMAVEAEHLPITAVRRVICVIMILMM